MDFTFENTAGYIGNETSSSLQLYGCKELTCRASERNEVLSDCFRIYLVLCGRGSIYIEQNFLRFGKENIFLIPPGVKAIYASDADAESRLLFLGFNGADAKGISGAIGFSDGLYVRRAGNAADIEKLMRVIGSLSDTQSVAGRFLQLSKFYELVSRMTKEDEKLKKTKLSHEYVIYAVNYLTDNLKDNISVSDIADKLNIDRTYLYKIFIKEMGVSPMAYLMEQRMIRAEELIRKTNKTLEEISHLSGFNNYANFKRIFYRKYGTAPQFFARRVRKSRD